MKINLNILVIDLAFLSSNKEIKLKTVFLFNINEVTTLNDVYFFIYKKFRFASYFSDFRYWKLSIYKKIKIIIKNN